VGGVEYSQGAAQGIQEGSGEWGPGEWAELTLIEPGSKRLPTQHCSSKGEHPRVRLALSSDYSR
jgi:hypothetical protein